MRNHHTLLSLFGLTLIVSSRLIAIPLPSAAEQADAHRWVTAKFEGRSNPTPDVGYLLPQLKRGNLETNSRQGHELRIEEKQFVRGLHCPSVGMVKVHLPAAGARFTAAVGVDSNDITYYSSLGRGSVTIAV